MRSLPSGGYAIATDFFRLGGLRSDFSSVQTLGLDRYLTHI
ncbi:hypothetical protein [Nostoc sphaeroides]|uniref:Uncharacterized protein n=1 Tax=Nostoc sphaeroides CCNUC1 TaxID=2653204 RepID=A0A5P8W5J0_9NOSO|nr:hypothetical protein [Nostoc sphaeroides]QFS47920.1 hypothetical protein GXM_05412 [Nostoc sphaeroides CCNUC1]